MKLGKESLLFLYNSEADDAILTLEGVIEREVSSRSEKEIISVNLKAKEAIFKGVKDIISTYGLDSEAAIAQINVEIKQLLSKKKVSHTGMTSDKPIPEKPRSEVITKKSSIFEEVESNLYLSLIEKECLLSVYDPAYKTYAIADLPDKAKRNYFRLAKAKHRMSITLQELI